jgi:AcrR family transcriptional regulator
VTPYNSPIRQRHAAQTRSEIAQAALRLFLEHGYAATTMAQIAKEAGVAVQTIYATYGSKRRIVQWLVDAIDELADIHGLIETVVASQDPREVVRTQVAITRRFRDGAAGEVVRVLLAAAESEPELRAVAAEGRRRHRGGAEEAARRVDQLGALRPGVTQAEAAAAISMLTSPASYAQLVEEHGWTIDDCEQWIARALERLLLARRRRAVSGA